MLSLTCKTAVKAVIFLATRHETGEKYGIRDIASHLDANEHTVGKLLQSLVKNGVINSLKGPAGGFYITSTQLRKPIMAIVEAIDGKEMFRECGLGLSKCSATRPCPIHDQYKLVRDGLEALFSENRIADLCDPVNQGLAYLS